MKDPFITREQSIGIHDVVNDRGFAMHHGVVCQLEVFRCERINTAKQKDGLTSFLMLSVLEAKIFQYDFWKDIMSEKITVIDRQHREM